MSILPGSLKSFSPTCNRFLYYNTLYSMPQTVFLAALNYQIDNLFDIDGVIPVIPEELSIVGKICGTAFKNQQSIGMVFESASAVFIVFRGTKTPFEGLKDLIAIPVDFNLVPNGGKVHRGFFDVYKSTRATVLYRISNLNANKQLFIVGHSLGGALATECALDLAVNSNFKKPNLITFGSPRVGDVQFVKQFDSTVPISVRVVNTFDWVPDVPPVEPFHFAHVKGEFKIEVNNKSGPGGFLFRDHLISTVYFPGLASLFPDYTRELCSKNPGFCPL